MYLWIAHFQDTDSYGQVISYISFIEGCFALAGLLFYDPINRRGFHLRPKNFERPPKGHFIHFIIIFVGLAAIQFTLLYVPLTVKDYEIALSIQFAGPSEEAFFRGVLVSLGIILLHKRGFKIPIMKKKMSIWELLWIILVSIGFAALHVNYYSNTRYLLGTFLCGLWFSGTYWYWRDLTACILAHSLLNFLVLIQTYWLVSF